MAKPEIDSINITLLRRRDPDAEQVSSSLLQPGTHLRSRRGSMPGVSDGCALLVVPQILGSSPHVTMYIMSVESQKWVRAGWGAHRRAQSSARVHASDSPCRPLPAGAAQCGRYPLCSQAQVKSQVPARGAQQAQHRCAQQHARLSAGSFSTSVLPRIDSWPHSSSGPVVCCNCRELR